MDATVGDILAALEAVAPAHLAEEWDNVGLQVGSRHWPVKRVLTALDPTPDVVREAQRRQADVLVTHHPLFFKPLTSLDLDTPLGAMLPLLFAGRIAVVSVHTNLDSVQGGVNDVLASMLELTDISVLQPSLQDAHSGLGRIGRLASPMPLAALAAAIKATSGVPSLRFAGDTTLMVHRVALCSGSGSSLLGTFLDSDAQVYVTGDVRYHDAREIEAHGRGVVDLGHFESEHIVLDTFTRHLTAQIRRRGLNVIVETCASEHAPFQTI